MTFLTLCLVVAVAAGASLPVTHFARSCRGNPGLLPPRPRGKVLLYIANDDVRHDKMIDNMRRNVPTWWRHFLEPQRLSLLVVLDALSHTAQRLDRFREFCGALGIAAHDLPPTGWPTRSYTSNATHTTIEMRLFNNSLPYDTVEELYERHNEDGTRTPIYWGDRRPSPCSRETAYTIGTRAYANPLLWRVGELDNVDFVVKLDFDVFFFDRLPLRVGDVMHATHTLVAHTGAECDGEPICAHGFEAARDAALRAAGVDLCYARRDTWTLADYFYSNLLFVSVPMMRHIATQKLLAHMYNLRQWFSARWTDQIVLHQPLLMLASKPHRRMLDLTQYRCVPRAADGSIPYLWETVRTRAEFERSCAGTVFHHKGAPSDVFAPLASAPPSARLQRPYCSAYKR